MPTPEPKKPHRRGASILFAVLGLGVVAAVVFVAVAFIGSGSDDRTLQITDDPSERRTPTTTTPPPEPTDPPTTVAPSTTVTTVPPPDPTLPASTAPGSPAPASTEPPLGPVTQSFTIPARTDRMCNEARVTVHFDPEPGDVAIRDDTGRTVGGWHGRSGESHRVDLPHPTRMLHVTVTAVGDHIRSSGSAIADAC